MRFVIELFLCVFFLTQSLLNIVRGLTAWQQWGDLASESWRQEYAERFCGRTLAAELNFTAARTFWAERVGDASGAFQGSWSAWRDTLLPYAQLGIRCNEGAYVAKQENNPSIPHAYPNWVVRYER